MADKDKKDNEKKDGKHVRKPDTPFIPPQRRPADKPPAHRSGR